MIDSSGSSQSITHSLFLLRGKRWKNSRYKLVLGVKSPGLGTCWNGWFVPASCQLPIHLSRRKEILLQGLMLATELRRYQMIEMLWPFADLEPGNAANSISAVLTTLNHKLRPLGLQVSFCSASQMGKKLELIAGATNTGEQYRKRWGKNMVRVAREVGT